MQDDINPYRSPTIETVQPEKSSRKAAHLGRTIALLGATFVVSSLLFFVIDPFAYVGGLSLRYILNSLLAAWAATGVLSKTSAEAVIVPLIGLGSFFGDGVENLRIAQICSVLLAIGISYVAHRIHESDSLAKRTLLRSIGRGMLGIALGMIVFVTTATLVGTWFSMFGAFCLFGAFGMMGVFTRNLYLSLVWCFLICCFHSGIRIEIFLMDIIPACLAIFVSWGTLYIIDHIIPTPYEQIAEGERD